MERPANPAPSLTVLRQYIKDLSFESPQLARYREIERRDVDRPARDTIAMGIQIGAISPDLFEVALVMRASTERDSLLGYVLEFVYAGLFNLRNFPPEFRHATLHIEAPAILFPFARKILTNFLQANGFPFDIRQHADFMQHYADYIASTR